MEALADYNTIMEAANENARKKLAEEFPAKFNELLKEEVNNKKNKSDKEPYKKVGEVKEATEVEESDENKNSVMESQIKKGKVNKNTPYGEDKKNVNKDAAEIPEQNKKGEATIDVNHKGRDKDFAGDVEADTPNLDKSDKGVPYKENVKSKNKKPAEKSNLKEEFDITELDENSVNDTLDSLSDDDEIITLSDIEAEISEMESLSVDGDEANQNSDDIDQYQELVDMRQTIDKILNNMSADGDSKEDYVLDLEIDDEVDDEVEVVDEHHLTSREDKINFIAGLNDEMIDQLYKSAETALDINEVDDILSDDDIDDILNGEGIDEVKINTHSAQKHVSNVITQDDILQNRKRFSQRDVSESKVKIKGLIEENKKLTKRLNEDKKYKESSTKLIENYRNALGKYRDQLKEMAVFNTNLSYVNNLLVNEELALTQKDKTRIVNEFKNVKTIDESKESYNNMLVEMKKSNRNILENIEGKVNSSIQPSSKKKLNEAIESTAYENNEHINKIKGLMNYIENRKK